MKKKLAAVAAILMMAAAITGCNGNSTTTTAADTAAVSQVTDASGAAETVEAGGGYLGTVDMTKIVGDMTADVANPEDFDITFKDFNKEYLFMLYNYDLNDTVEANLETCNHYRSSIMDYLMKERRMMRVAEENGVGVSALTSEDLTTIQTKVDTTIQSWLASYETEALAVLPEDATAEEKTAKENELFDAYLADCGLTQDDFYIWQRNSYIESKLMNILLKDVTVTDEELTEFLDNTVEAAKAAYAKDDKSEYFDSETYKAVYIPEGSRNIKHILFQIDTDSQNEISTLRSSGDDEGANKLRDEKLAELKDKATAALERIKAGEDFDTVMKECSDDTDGQYYSPEGYQIVPGAITLASEFTDAGFALEKIGDTSAELVASDYGYHILKYASDASVTDEEWANLKESANTYLLSYNSSVRTNEIYAEWAEKYPYTIDKETLKITDTTSTAAADTTTA